MLDDPIETRSTCCIEETLLDKCINNYITTNRRKINIKGEWIMIDELKAKYVAKLQALESKNIDVLVQEKFDEVKEQIKQEVLAKHNEEIEIAKFQVKAIDEMIADQEAEQLAELEAQEQTENQVEG